MSCTHVQLYVPLHKHDPDKINNLLSIFVINVDSMLENIDLLYMYCMYLCCI